MSDNWIDEPDEILQRLASASARLDPVPIDVVEAAVACFKWRAIDAELAGLLFDSDMARRPAGSVSGPREGDVGRGFGAPRLA